MFWGLELLYGKLNPAACTATSTTTPLLAGTSREDELFGEQWSSTGGNHSLANTCEIINPHAPELLRVLQLLALEMEEEKETNLVFFIWAFCFACMENSGRFMSAAGALASPWVALLIALALSLYSPGGADLGRTLRGKGIAICPSICASGKRSSRGVVSSILRELVPGIICPPDSALASSAIIVWGQGWPCWAVFSRHFVPTVTSPMPKGCAGAQPRTGGRMGTGGTQHPTGSSSGEVTSETMLSSVRGHQGIKGWGDSWASKDWSSHS